MRARIAPILLAVLFVVLLAPSVDAGWLSGWFGGQAKLPRPISALGRNVSESYKVGNRMRHPEKYYDVTWGNRWKQFHASQAMRVGHYNKY